VGCRAITAVPAIVWFAPVRVNSRLISGLQFWQSLAIPAMLAILLTALCLRPSATAPTPLDVLLQAKAKVPFDRAVTERSKSSFFVFSAVNQAQFQPDFSFFTVRSAEGRKLSLGLAERWIADY
jgi:hypothetical protein